MFPELAVCGYPPADFLEKPSFVARAGAAIAEIAAAATAGSPLTVICGYVTEARPESGKHVVNSAALLRYGAVEFVQSKRLLPFYDVFDEQRYFDPAEKQDLYPLGDQRLAVTICEDAWNDKLIWPRRLYTVDPTEELMRIGFILQNGRKGLKRLRFGSSLQRRNLACSLTYFFARSARSFFTWFLRDARVPL